MNGAKAEVLTLTGRKAVWLSGLSDVATQRLHIVKGTQTSTVHVLSADYVWRKNLILGAGKHRSLRTVDTGLYTSSLRVSYSPFSKQSPTINFKLKYF